MRVAMRSGGGWWLWAMLLWAGLTVTAVGQESPAANAANTTPNMTPTFHAESSLVLVPALVMTAQGRVVFGLQEKDFLVTDNGVEEAVQLDETYASRPVSLVIAVQRGGRAPEVLGGGCPAAKQENMFTKQVVKCVSPLRGIGVMLETFVRDPGSEMALVSFDSQVHLRQKFTAEVETVTKELEQLPAGDGGSAILDAIQLSLDLLRHEPEDHRRVLVVVSEKVDRGSSRISLQEAARQIAGTNTEIYMVAIDDDPKEGIRTMARLLGPSLMMLGHSPREGGGGRGMGMGGMHGGGMDQAMGPLSGAAATAASTTQAGRKGTKSGNGDDSQGDGSSSGGDQAGSGNQVTPLGMVETRISLGHTGNQGDIPQTIANLTGGEYVLFSDTRGLDEALGLLANHAHNRYLLSYRVQGSEPGMHRISVQLREAMGVQVAARTSYWQVAGAEKTGRVARPAK